MRRLVCCLTLLTVFFVHSPVALESSRALSFTRLGMTVKAVTFEEIITLPFETPLTGTLAPRSSGSCGLGETQYVIQYPGGATRVKIQITVPAAQAASLFVFARFGQRVTRENDRLLFDFATSGTAPLYFPTTGPHLFEAGPYYIALNNCSTDPLDFTIRATLLLPTEGDTATLTPETSFGAIPAGTPDSCSLSPTQYRVLAPGGGPCGGIFLGIGAQSDQNITLYARRDQRVAIEDGHIVADLVTTTTGKTQFFNLTTSGIYYIAVGNCSTATANYTISTSLIAIDPPFPALVNRCQLVREPNGRLVLDVYGANIHAGATVTVGGIAPKKIRFVELEDGSTTTYKHIRLVKKFCGGLPGNIVVSNSGPCSFSQAFFCNERCPD